MPLDVFVVLSPLFFFFILYRWFPRWLFAHFPDTPSPVLLFTFDFGDNVGALDLDAADWFFTGWRFAPPERA